MSLSQRSFLAGKPLGDIRNQRSFVESLSAARIAKCHLVSIIVVASLESYSKTSMSLLNKEIHSHQPKYREMCF